MIAILTTVTVVLWLIDWQKDFGGYTSYIADGEDEEVSCLLLLAVLLPLPLLFHNQHN